MGRCFKYECKNPKSRFHYLKYNNLEDMLKIMLASSQSAIGINSLLYFINYHSKNIIFIYNSSIGSSLIHYTVVMEKPKDKFIRSIRQVENMNL
jgi:hypothetical protein